MGNLTTLSIDYLYEGLVLPDDIYNFDSTIILLKKGARGSR
jgi:hypothetical protein